MSTRASWRSRFPALASLLDDPRVHSIFVDPAARVEARALDGVLVDIAPPALSVANVRLLAKEGSSDELATLTVLQLHAGVAVQLTKRARDDRALEAPLLGLIEPALALGASALVVGPRAAARAEAVATLARVIRGRRRMLSLDPNDPGGVSLSALSSLAALDDAALIAGDLTALEAAIVIRAPIPCLASIPGVGLEAGLARLAGQVALERPGIAFASVSSAIVGRFDLGVEVDETRIIALAELSVDTRTGGVAMTRIAVRAPSGAFELALGGSRVEKRLAGLIEGAHSPSTRPERAPPRIRTSASRVSPVPNVVRAPLVRELPSPPPLDAHRPISQRETQELSASDPLESSKPPVQPRASQGSRLTPIVAPPRLGSQDPARAAMSAPSGMREVPDSTGDLAPDGPAGKVQLDAVSELTPDQLVSQSFIVDTGSPPDETRLVPDPPLSEPPSTDFEEATSNAEIPQDLEAELDSPPVMRAALERLSTEIADGKSGSLAAPAPAVISYGASERTMQIPASMIKPAIDFMDEATMDPSVVTGQSAAVPQDSGDDERSNNTAFGMLTPSEPTPPIRAKRKRNDP